MNSVLPGVLQSIPALAVLVTVMLYGLRWLRADIKDLKADLKDDIKRIEGKVDKLSEDHNNLANQLSEVKGYLKREPPEVQR